MGVDDAELIGQITSYAKELLDEKVVVVFEGGGMGSEDFASYSYEVPSVYLLLGAGVYAYSAIMWLKNNK
ncbi:MAG: hypothetical protein ACRCTE_07270 [Cellulosilyticaceae bacterium]